MRVLVIGSGGREHALVWKLAQSNLCEKVFVAPGNAGTADEPKTENVDLSAEDLDGLLDFAKNKDCLLYTSPSPRDEVLSRMPSSA